MIHDKINNEMGKYNFAARSSVGLLLLSLGLSWAQPPWPVERQDRWGSGRAIFGPDPATLTTPWIFANLSRGWVVSHGASLDTDGIGYYADWQPQHVYKFNYNTGAILGAFNALGYVPNVPAIAAPNRVYARSDRGFCIDTSIMDYVWFYSNAGSGRNDFQQASANVGPEGDLILGNNSGVAARRRLSDGQVVWSHSGMGQIAQSIMFSRDDSTVFVSNGNSMTALRWSDGSQLWTRNLGSYVGSSGVAADGTLVFGTEGGTIYAVDPTTGANRWTFAALDAIWAAPAFSANGVCYVPSLDHRLYAFDVATGTRLWSFTTSAQCMTPASVDTSGRIYLINRSGDFYCLAPDQTVIWQVHYNGDPRGSLTIGPDGSLYCGIEGGVSGLFIVRQQALTLAINQITMDRGSIVSGGLPEIGFSDDQYLVMRNGVTALPTEPPIRVVLSAVSNYTALVKLSFKLEAGVSIANLQQIIELRNYSTGTWDTIDSRPATLADSTTLVTVAGNPSQYVQQGSGLMNARPGWKPIGPLFSNVWFARIDEAKFISVPAW